MAWIPAAIAGVASIAGGLLSSSGGGDEIDLGPGEGTFKRQVIPQIIELLRRNPEALTAALGPGLQGSLGGLAGWGGGQGGSILDSMLGNAQGANNAFAMSLDRLGQPSVVNPLDLGEVGRIADNPYTQGMINASLRDPFRQLTEQDLPMLGLNSAGTGNTGSSRRGMAEGILQRGFEDRAADISSSILGTNYNTGLGIEAERMGLNAQLQQERDLTGLNLGNLGLDTLTSANGLGLSNLMAGFNAGDYLRNYEQQRIDAPVQNLGDLTRILLPATGMAQSGRGGLATGLGTFATLYPAIASMFGDGTLQKSQYDGGMKVSPVETSRSGWFDASPG